jgi:hypothetical protein
MIIYNLAEDLRANLPDEDVMIHTWGDVYPDDLPDRVILLKDSSATPQEFTNVVDPHLIQILVRDIDSVRAYNLSYQIYDIYKDRLNFILPAINLNGIIYPEIKIDKMVPNVLPQGLGNDTNNRAIFSTNYRLFYFLGE